MIFSLLILGGPLASQSGDSAWHFAKAAVDSGHQLHRIFFYHEGVYHGSGFSIPPQDEVNRLQRWTELSSQSGVELVLCISSAARRGLLDLSEAHRHSKAAATVPDAFTLSGLGELVDATANSDRLITFGC
jgi:tRNA 2-thiouridine synthesizing protein D